MKLVNRLKVRTQMLGRGPLVRTFSPKTMGRKFGLISEVVCVVPLGALFLVFLFLFLHFERNLSSRSTLASTYQKHRFSALDNIFTQMFNLIHRSVKYQNGDKTPAKSRTLTGGEDRREQIIDPAMRMFA